MSNADRLIELFNGAQDLLAGTVRDAYLAEECGDDAELMAQVISLVEAHESAGGFLQTGLERSPEIQAQLARLTPEVVGQEIGPYKLREQIGEGGFGTVWVAEQERPVRRTVALKILKLGMDTQEVVARFGQERQALAMMDHPNIAKIFDAGVTDHGRPFFVMELVDGIKITDYCDQANLPTADRLALFIEVCHAVQHAHQKGIIHRDLKPSNILVTQHDGLALPKVIDFGVAKATQGRLADNTVYTRIQQMIGTPLYMSPEQAEMNGADVDTRTDIYTLGVLLYELLTGRTPFDADALLKAGYDEMRRVIREQEPQKPSTALVTMAQEVVTAVAHHRASEPPKLIHAIRGDLDWIVMKTLDKDRARRYETANGLAMDIQRHLDNEPVVARPPGNLYRFQKLVRRNRLAVVAVGMVAAVLVVGAVVSTWQAIRATRAEQAQIRLREEAENARNNEAKLRILAETETARSAQVAQFMQGMLNGVGPAVARGRDTGLLQEILDQTARRLDELDTQPAVDADLRDTLGTVYRDLAEYPAAADMHRQALDLRKELHGAEHPSVASTLNKLGGVLHRQRKHAEAEKVYREALAMQRKFLSGEYADIALTLNNLGSILRIQGKLQEAEDILREALAMRRSLWSNEHVDVAESLSNLGLLLRAQGGDKLVEAEVIFRETLEMRKKLLPDDHPSIADTLGDLGLTLDRQGKSAEAEKLLRESLVLKRKLLDSDHPEVVKALATIVPVLTRRRKYAEAEILQRELLALRRKLPDDDHPDVVAALAELASLLNRQGKHAEVEAIYREAIPLQKKLVGEADPSVATLLEALGQALSAGGKLAEAERTDREVLDMRTKQPGKNPELSIPLSALANSIARQGRFAEAESMFSEAISAQRKRVGEEDRSVANLLDAFGNFLRTNGHAPKAEVIIREAVAMRRKLFGNDDRDLIPSLHALFLVLSNQGKLEEAVVTVREEVALRRKLHGNVDGTANALGSLGRSLLTRGRSGDAEPIIREGAELGSRWSQQALGQMYATGEGVAKDPVEAAKWFRKAAERGETGAQYTLGKMYATGTGVAKDPVEAAKWFRKVAECDSASNLNHLAWNLATSVDTERDGLTAVNLAEKAVAMTDGKEPILLDTLAAAHAEVGQFEKAVSLQQEAIALLQDEKQKKDFASRLKLYQSGIPCRNPDSLATKVRELLDAGKFDEAEPLARQCLVIREQQIPGHWRTFNARSMLGGSLLGQKKPAEAEPFLLAGYEGLKQREDEIPAAGKVNVKKALQLLVQLYETTGRPEQASRWKGVLAGFEESEARKNSAPPP